MLGETILCFPGPSGPASTENMPKGIFPGRFGPKEDFPQAPFQESHKKGIIIAYFLMISLPVKVRRKKNHVSGCCA